VKAFAYVNPTTEKEAVAALKIDGIALPLAGGMDLIARMKDYIDTPDRIVNVKGALDGTITGTPVSRSMRRWRSCIPPLRPPRTRSARRRSATPVRWAAT
jgi:hypothetical protein